MSCGYILHDHEQSSERAGELRVKDVEGLAVEGWKVRRGATPFPKEIDKATAT